MYWSDGELFRGILREIIDRRDDKSSSFFVKDSFREKANAEKQGFMWAYFRIPALAALITTIFLVYAIFKAETLLSRSITLLLMMLLWFMPSFIAFYRSRASVSDVDKKSFRLVLQKPFSKGILSNLLWIAVEWRRILCVQCEGDNVDKENIHARISFQLGDFNPFSWSFYWRWVWRVSFSIIILLLVVAVSVLIYDGRSLTEIFHWQEMIDIWAGLGNKSELEKLLSYKEKDYYKIALLSVILFNVIYLLVMIYEMNIFIKTKKKYYKNRSGYFGKLLMRLDALMRYGKQ
jgi:hypothetical protein